MEDPTKTTSPEGEAQLPAKPAKAAEAVAEKPEGEAVEAKVTEAPKPRLYSEEEFRKAQSAWGKEKTTLESRTKELEGLYQTLATQTEEAKIASWLKSVEGTGNEDVTLVARQVADAQKAVSQQIKDIARQKKETDERDAQVKEGLKVLAAHEIVKAHSLDDAALEKLLTAKDPTEMENIALKIRIDKYNAERNLPKKVDQGGGSGKALDWSKLSDSERMGRAIELATSK